MGRINILPPELVNHIAAGEVVERPASVVKELVENSVDAGSTQIDIQIRNGGRSLRIADNGCGMDESDLRVAFTNHATSKITELGDLFNIHTLGFRGEALATVSAVAKVTCSSRPHDAEHGLKAQVAHDGQVTLHPTGCAPGTVFDIEDLFYNVPARLKFLKRPQTEVAHITETLQQLALSHPHIAFTVKDEDRVVLKTDGSGQLEAALRAVFNLPADEPLLPVAFDDNDTHYHLSGFTSPPNVYRSSKKWMTTFVNGRMVSCAMFNKAIELAYQGLITPGKYPVTALFLTLPPDEVDVNVHPTKKEVKYQNANVLFSFIRHGVLQALTPQAPNRESVPTSSPEPATAHATSMTPSLNQTAVIAPIINVTTAPPPLTAAVAEPLVTPKQQAIAFDQHEPAINTWRVIGQLAKTYILVESPEGLLIVDQHIASERTHYERFYEQYDTSPHTSQALLVPMTQPLSVEMADTLQSKQGDLRQLGFDFKLDSDAQQVQWTHLPQWFSGRHQKEALIQLLEQLENTQEVHLSQVDVIATMACHTAVRAGDSLNQLQMESIIHQWQRCERPWTCPHGRPVYHEVPHSTMMNWFDRPSLPTSLGQR